MSSAPGPAFVACSLCAARVRRDLYKQHIAADCSEPDAEPEPKRARLDLPTPEATPPPPGRAEAVLGIRLVRSRVQRSAPGSHFKLGLLCSRMGDDSQPRRLHVSGKTLRVAGVELQSLGARLALDARLQGRLRSLRLPIEGLEAKSVRELLVANAASLRFLELSRMTGPLCNPNAVQLDHLTSAVIRGHLQPITTKLMMLPASLTRLRLHYDYNERKWRSKTTLSAALGRLVSLKRLRISTSCIGMPWIGMPWPDCLSSGILFGLRELDIWQLPGGDLGKACPQLESLTIRSWKPTRGSPGHLPGLAQLRLCVYGVSNAELAWLAQLPGLRQLSLASEGQRDFAFLAPLRLESLRLLVPNAFKGPIRLPLQPDRLRRLRLDLNPSRCWSRQTWASVCAVMRKEGSIFQLSEVVAGFWKGVEDGSQNGAESLLAASEYPALELLELACPAAFLRRLSPTVFPSLRWMRWRGEARIPRRPHSFVAAGPEPLRQCQAFAEAHVEKETQALRSCEEVPRKLQRGLEKQKKSRFGRSKEELEAEERALEWETKAAFACLRHHLGD